MQRYSPEEARRRHIEIARKGLRDFLARQAEKPVVQIEVDGHASSTESNVKPFGIIVYRFVRREIILRAALAEVRRLSPVRSGRYRDSWFFTVGGAEVDINHAPDGANEFLLLSDAPYSRKINVGAKGFEAYAPPGIVEKAKEIIKRRYGAHVEMKVVFVTLRGGHTLRNDQYRKDRRGRRMSSPRRDARAGMQITYPALQIVFRH